MKRISDEKIKKMKMGTILIFSLSLLLSGIICFLPDIFPEPKYDELNEKDIIVSKLTTGQVELVEFSSLYSIKKKKIVEDSAQSSQAFQGPTSTTISISDLLDIVNETC